VRNITVARRYAKALLAVGKEDGSYKQYAEELAAFSGIVKDNFVFLQCLSNPLYPLGNRKTLLENVLAKTGFSSTVNSFLKLLMDKSRIDLVIEIVAFYQKFVDELSSINAATVISTSELSDVVITQIKEALQKMTGKQIRIESKIDPSIIGGIITMVGDKHFDGSVRTHLVNLKETLKRGE